VQNAAGFEDAPDRFGLVEIVEDIESADAARVRRCRRLCRPAFDHAAMVIAKLS